MNDKEMESVLGRLVELSGRIYAREAHWQMREMALMPPAKPAAIQQLSASRPFPLPATYSAFLKLHDGCLGLWPKYALLGTSGEPRKIIEAEVADAEETQKSDIESTQSAFNEEAIARFEKPDGDEQYVFIPRHTVIGTNKRGGFLILNERQLSSGEPEVLYYTYDVGVRARYPGFPDFLRAKVEELEKHIKTKRY
jgi:hypothetical protein